MRTKAQALRLRLLVQGSSNTTTSTSTAKTIAQSVTKPNRFENSSISAPKSGCDSDKLVTRRGAFVHWISFRHDDNKKKTSRQVQSFLLLLLQVHTQLPTLNWTFKVPMMGRDVLIGFHKSRRPHRERSADSVIGEVIMQVACQKFVHFFCGSYIYKFCDKKKICFRRK